MSQFFEPYIFTHSIQWPLHNRVHQTHSQIKGKMRYWIDFRELCRHVRYNISYRCFGYISVGVFLNDLCCRNNKYDRFVDGEENMIKSGHQYVVQTSAPGIVYYCFKCIWTVQINTALTHVAGPELVLRLWSYTCLKLIENAAMLKRNYAVLKGKNRAMKIAI